VRATLDTTEVRARVTYDPRVRLTKRGLAVPPESSGFQRSVPSYIVMFLLMTLMTSGATVLISERQEGKLRRMLVSSTASDEIVLGKFVSRFAFAGLQIAVMLGAGLAFRVRFGSHPVALFVLLASFALCATGLGLLFASFFKNPDKGAGFGSLVVLVMAPLGGCWWPLEIVPQWMRQLAWLFPTGWGFDGLNRVMALDAGLSQLLPHLAYLLGVAALALPAAALRLRRTAG
jgi:ABC-2 type transport system permease protein